MFPDVDLAEALEEGEQSNVQALVGALPVALLVPARVAHCDQAKHPHTQIPVQQLLQREDVPVNQLAQESNRFHPPQTHQGLSLP